MTYLETIITFVSAKTRMEAWAHHLFVGDITFLYEVKDLAFSQSRAGVSVMSALQVPPTFRNTSAIIV
jgi:hypothetical protein